jgi:signal transduction histidine kinase
MPDYGTRPVGLAAVADHEDRMHAVRSGLAAVTAAVQLLTAAEPVSEMQQRLGPMVIEELQRLQRLASARDLSSLLEQPAREMDLDEIIRDVVLTRRVAHQDVSWEDTGLVVRGRRDVVVELLNILLVNAWRHAPGAATRIRACRDGSMIRVRVTDTCPGVPKVL